MVSWAEGPALPECGSFSLHTLRQEKRALHATLRKAGVTWYFQAEAWHAHTENSNPNHREQEAGQEWIVFNLSYFPSR